MKKLFENFRKFVKEENLTEEDATEQDIEDAARDLIGKEGGAIGRKMLKDPEELKPFLDEKGLEIPDDFDLDAFIDEFIEGSEDIGVHRDKDIIAGDDEEINITKEDIAEGLEIFFEAQEEMLDEKRKRSKKRTKKKRAKKKKKGKRDACYYKVKARYKVWPSAYASGALVKCRKKGAKNWGTGGKKKKNESLSKEDIVMEKIESFLNEKGGRCQKGYKTHSKRKTKKMYGNTYRNCVKAEEKEVLEDEILEVDIQGLEEAELQEKKKTDGKKSSDPGYNLKDWFKGGGWVQVGGKYDGKPCAKQPGQKTKPYCRDADDRKGMSKKEKERRVRKKRKKDPNPERRGKAINVSQKKRKRKKKKSE